MSRLDDLPPDQLAALSLVLGRGKRYAEVAQLLGIAEQAVHDRAHAALAVLAPAQARGLTPEQRAQIGDYLLGQQDALADRLGTRSLLEGSPAAREWASALSSQLAALSQAPLPEIPAPAVEHASVQAPTAPPPVPPSGPAPAPASASAAAPASPPTGVRAGASAALPSSRTGGALLLAGIVVVVVVLVLVLSGGGSHSHTGSGASAAATGSSTTGTSSTGASSTGTSSSGTSSTGSSSGRASEDRRITLTPTEPSSKAIGVAEVLSEGDKYAFYMFAEHLPPSKGFYYAVWLYNSPTAYEALSRSPTVGSNGRLQGGALLPEDAAKYHTMVLTRETSERPTHPGPIVLSGAFGLH